MTVTIYGLRNCDSCKKALKWLTDQQIDHSFIDFKTSPPDQALVAQLLDQIPLKKLLNKRSTTWKQLSSNEQLLAESQPAELLMKYPNLIKRPVSVLKNTADVGFSPDIYAKTMIEDK